jgi:pyruvate/2-oxoglutarate dehydrogenase complex dihydrolipoamide dehydrogenase (E3) component
MSSRKKESMDMSSTETDRLDALVIGTGQAGKPLAGAIAEAGWRAAIVERDRVGGTCVIRGCTPTKAMVASARVAHLARRASDYGVRTGSISVDMEVVRKRKRDIVDSWSEGSRKGMERHDSLELVMGHARFVDDGTVEVVLQEGGTRRLQADRIFLNTGARPRIPPIEGLDEVPFLDSTSIMELGRVPEHLLVLGGGFIGLEFGQMFRRFGAQVTVIQAAPRLAPREDEDVSEAIREIREDDGIRVLTDARAVGARSEANGVVLDLVSPEGDTEELWGSHLLVATGRIPNTDDLGLAAAGLSTDEEGFVPVNDRLETSKEGIWALGDVNGGPPFTHTAYDDYRIVRQNVLGEGGASRAGRIGTYTVFIDPQLGRVGLTEDEARAAGHEVRVARLPMNRVARAIEMDETRGFMKAVVDAETDQILGAAILGVEGGEVAAVLLTAMMGKLPWTTLRDGVIAHPTLAESLNNLFATLD